MKRYLVIVPHKSSKKSCDIAVDVFRSTGSHFLTNAVFGCPDKVHKAWINIEANTREGALRMVPPPFREKAKAIRVRRFALETVGKKLTPHHK